MWKSIWRGALGVLGALVVVALVALAILVFPATPKSTGALRFAGFIGLPRAGGGGPLTILDYLTVEGRTLYVANISAGAVYQVPLSGAALPPTSAIAVLPGPPAAHGAAVDPVSGAVFVSRSGADTVDAFDPTSRAVLARIPVAADVDAILYDPALKLIYAGHGEARLATLIDPATRARVATIPLGGAPEFPVFDPATGLIYQNLEDVNAVAVVDVARRAVRERWPLKGCRGPTGAALDQANRRLFVVCGANDALVVVDLASHGVVASLPIGGGPDSVAFDPGLRRIYVTGRSGVLTVTRQDGPDTYRALDRIPLHYGAHTLAIDPATHRLYVAYASLLLPPRLAVFDAVP